MHKSNQLPEPIMIWQRRKNITQISRMS